ncbi:D-alanine--D-alanine ligase [bacterium]|nr:D-alanine--D-alanine ligase [bacterium]
MKNPAKLKVMVLYGGRSGEHEVSLVSAASVMRNLNPEKYEVLPVAIDKKGRWLFNDMSLIERSARALPVYQDAPEVMLLSQINSPDQNLIFLESKKSTQVDVVFPVMHGTLSEDGTIQGFLELTDLPYVGCGVLASAVGMDKEFAKRLVHEAGLPIVPYLCVKQASYEKSQKQWAQRVEKELGFPVFVKPANSGSSVGVYKVKTLDDLHSCLEKAFQFDHKVLIEKAVSAREIEFAVLENLDSSQPPHVSTPGEIAPTHEFYSYEAKYLDENGAHLMIPASLTEAQLTEGKELAARAFEALNGEGMSRVDLFLDKSTGQFYFNEVNTIPGFTSISMYPKLWECSGVSYSELLDRLIALAIARSNRKKKLKRDLEV